MRRALSPLQVVSIPICSTRNIFGVSFSGEDHHLIKTLNYFENNRNWRLEDTPTFMYHQSFKPKNFFEVSSISGSEQLPIFHYPWGTFSSGDVYSNKSQQTSRFVGPSDYDLIEREINDLLRLWSSIKRYGYNPYTFPHADINGTILVPADGRKRVCVIMQGNHRVAVMAYLGYRNVPVVPGKLCLRYVFEEALDDWPLVRSGVIDRNVALSVFNFFINRELNSENG